MSSDPGAQLPDMVVTPLELGKIQRELHAVDVFLSASQRSTAKMPFMSQGLQKLASQSGLNLLQTNDREQLIKQLEFVRRTAPTVQMSFASEPSKPALRALIRWFRDNGHPNTLISVGVQPSIGGGCVVRTASREFDFSLQKLFQDHTSELAKQFSA